MTPAAKTLEALFRPCLGPVQSLRAPALPPKTPMLFQIDDLGSATAAKPFDVLLNRRFLAPNTYSKILALAPVFSRLHALQDSVS